MPATISSKPHQGPSGPVSDREQGRIDRSVVVELERCLAANKFAARWNYTSSRLRLRTGRGGVAHGNLDGKATRPAPAGRLPSAKSEEPHLNLNGAANRSAPAEPSSSQLPEDPRGNVNETANRSAPAERSSPEQREEPHAKAKKKSMRQRSHAKFAKSPRRRQLYVPGRRRGRRGGRISVERVRPAKSAEIDFAATASEDQTAS